MEWATLAVIWFVIEGILLIGYAILDGFDLGVGILHPFVPTDDHERRIAMNSIGPLWDGNEVWLVTFGGALFAAFPEAYATAFSGFYTAFMLLLVALIFRAVSMELRSKVTSTWWRRFGISPSSVVRRPPPCCSASQWETRFWACLWTRRGTLPAPSLIN